jgi:hypothetical protein
MKPSANNINRLYVYEVANKLNIQFPNTWIGNILSECPFLLKTKNIKFLIKSLNFPYLSVRHKEYLCHLSSPSILIDENLLKSKMLPKKFFHSFFQQYIDKKYEIRTFYLKGVFKSMAIFSQQDAKTQTDFRNYDEERPNRCIPYMLPKIFEKKLHKLMQLLKINCGSIDILVTPNDEFYFLEVNPIGYTAEYCKCFSSFKRKDSIKIIELCPNTEPFNGGYGVAIKYDINDSIRINENRQTIGMCTLSHNNEFNILAQKKNIIVRFGFMEYK